ncbi:IS3 family transposase [Lachnobacterium bovis]
MRRVLHELINHGYQINHKRVQRLMHEAGLAGKRPKEKYHSYKGEVGKIADNVIDRDFSTTAPLQKWTTKFTYILNTATLLVHRFITSLQLSIQKPE